MKRLTDKIPLELITIAMLAMPGLIVILGVYLVGALALDVALIAIGAANR